MCTSKPVLSIGETLIDLIASDGSTRLEDVSSFAVRPGGAPANAAVALARLGVRSAFCGVVGADPFGDRLRTTLDDNNVDTSRVRSAENQDTTIAFAWKDNRGDGHFRLIRMADVLLDTSDIEQAGIDKLAAVVVGSVSLAANPSRSAVHRAVEIARVTNVPVCFDVNVRPTLWSSREEALAACEPVFKGATLLKLSLDDARFLFEVDSPEQSFRAIAKYPARFRVLTDGARGAWFEIPNGFDSAVSHVPAFQVDAIDPTGAGDAFTAAIVVRLIECDWRALDIADIKFAAAAGALTTTKRGAIAALPTREDVTSFMQGRKA
jgi:fructokinase